MSTPNWATRTDDNHIRFSFDGGTWEMWTIKNDPGPLATAYTGTVERVSEVQVHPTGAKTARFRVSISGTDATPDFYQHGAAEGWIVGTGTRP